MTSLENITGNDDVTTLSDPFKKDKITAVSINCFILMSGNWCFSGRVKFKNGNTEGTHEIEGASIDDVYIRIANFIKSL